MIVHIFTVGLIQFIYGLYPKVEKLFRYEDCSLEESDILGIFCQDGKFYFESIKRVEIEKIENKDLELPQLKGSKICILFTFKLFTYIYNSETKCFNSLKFDIQRKNSYILQKLSKGLTKPERVYQKVLYGECELNFYIKSFIETVKKFDTQEYRFAISETKTFNVIRDVGEERSEIGVLFLSQLNAKVLQHYFDEYDLTFTGLVDTSAYVYLHRKHGIENE